MSEYMRRGQVFNEAIFLRTAICKTVDTPELFVCEPLPLNLVEMTQARRVDSRLPQAHQVWVVSIRL